MYHYMEQVLFIPRVDKTIKEHYMYKILKELNMGKICRIDIAKKHKETYNCAFIHLKWNHSENARIAQEFLSSGKSIKTFYDDYWFWKISIYKSSKKEKKDDDIKEKEV